MNVFVLLASACPYSRSYVAPSFHFQNCDRSIGISAISRKTCLCFCLCLCLCSSENQPLLPTELSGNKDWNENGPKPVCLLVFLMFTYKHSFAFEKISYFLLSFCQNQTLCSTVLLDATICWNAQRVFK